MGAFRETHFSPTGNCLPGGSVISVGAKSRFLWMSRGLSLQGVAHNESKLEVRAFEGMEYEINCRNPLTIAYTYAAAQKGKRYWQEGLIQFCAREKGKTGRYMQANGHFDLPVVPFGRIVRISFHWERIPPDEIRAAIGKNSLDSIGDIRRFIAA
jgi:hypothetical protein